MSSLPSWTAPHWSHPPSPPTSWKLLEIKQGILISTHSLTALSARRAGCITIGRIDDPALTDIPVAHESCSRLHARIAFDSRGVPWLRDLGSNHGTFVNGVRLPREACGRDEADDGSRGSRGVVLYPGDVLRFGASTRIFCLEGPEEFDRGMEGGKRDEKKSEKEENSLVVDEDKRGGNGEEEDQSRKQIVAECHWGMADDEAEYNEQNEHQVGAPSMLDPNLPSIEAFFSSSSKYTIPSSLQQLYKTQQTKLGKLHSLQIESQRIMQKEDRGVELTDGQTKQLEKNRERMENLENDLEELHAKLQEGIYSIVHGVNVNLARKRRIQSKNDNEDEDVDDFYDRTATTNKKRRDSEQEPEAESEQSLIQKWKALYSSHQEQCERASRASHKCREIQSEIHAADDEEEAFFLQNDLTLANEEWSKANSLLTSTEKEWEELEFLLKIVNPKLSWNRIDGWIGVGGDRPAGRAGSQKEDVSGGNGTSENNVLIIMPPPPNLHGGETSSSDPAMSSDGNDASSLAPSPSVSPSESLPSRVIQAPRAVGPTMPHPPINEQGNQQTLSHSRAESRAPTSTKNKRQVGPSRPSTVFGTLAALQQAIHPQSNKEKSSLSTQPTTKTKLSAPIFDPRKDEWKAPTNQDGSGRTSLHDKFKGRY
ncbi:hypothetical protein ACHAW6_008932 [Cyclotella cf. meneghiniana]